MSVLSPLLLLETTFICFSARLFYASSFFFLIAVDCVLDTFACMQMLGHFLYKCARRILFGCRDGTFGFPQLQRPVYREIVQTLIYFKFVDNSLYRYSEILYF